MNTSEGIRVTLLGEAPRIAETYGADIISTFERLTGKFGAALKGVYSHQMVHQFNAIRGSVTSCVANNIVTYSIDPVRLQENAKKYSEATVLTWADRIYVKVGDLTDLRMGSKLIGNTFRIVGKRGNDGVSIEQSMVVNCSPRGILFKQFPSRICVNGRFISAAKYKTGIIDASASN